MENSNLDLLKKVEDLTAKANDIFKTRTKSVVARYPLTFALLLVFGVTMVTEGVKEILLRIGFLVERPWMMLILGIIVLVFTGTLYKKLNKEAE